MQLSIFILFHQNNVTESDIVVDVSGNSFEASIKLGTWIYQMDIGKQTNTSVLNVIN